MILLLSMQHVLVMQRQSTSWLGSTSLLYIIVLLSKKDNGSIYEAFPVMHHCSIGRCYWLCSTLNYFRCWGWAWLCSTAWLLRNLAAMLADHLDLPPWHFGPSSNQGRLFYSWRVSNRGVGCSAPVRGVFRPLSKLCGLQRLRLPTRGVVK